MNQQIPPEYNENPGMRRIYRLYARDIETGFEFQGNVCDQDVAQTRRGLQSQGLEVIVKYYTFAETGFLLRKDGYGMQAIFTRKPARRIA